MRPISLKCTYDLIRRTMLKSWNLRIESNTDTSCISLLCGACARAI